MVRPHLPTCLAKRMHGQAHACAEGGACMAWCMAHPAGAQLVLPAELEDRLVNSQMASVAGHPFWKGAGGALFSHTCVQGQGGHWKHALVACRTGKASPCHVFLRGVRMGWVGVRSLQLFCLPFPQGQAPTRCLSVGHLRRHDAAAQHIRQCRGDQPTPCHGAHGHHSRVQGGVAFFDDTM